MTSFKIVEKKNLWFLISTLVILVGFGLMANRAINHQPSLNYGIDFIGGSTMMLKFDTLNQKTQDIYTSDERQNAHLEFMTELRGVLKTIGLEKSRIQITDNNEVIIKTSTKKSDDLESAKDHLGQQFGSIEVLEIDFIGPSIGLELREKSFWIITITTLALLFYISWRFEFTYGVSALIALIHDAMVTVSIASILNIEINTAFVAALLTILGYSINDTIVVFDRIRENMKKLKGSVNDIANTSLNQTLFRTINTSLTTLAVIGSLLVLGGSTIKPFALVLLIGVLAGTYSSIFIATPVLTKLQK